MSVIQVENASKIYRVGEVEAQALDGVDVAVEGGGAGPDPPGWWAALRDSSWAVW
ncbi:MAG: hypothetical protein R2911_14360 [Caldilineaceae bacterium]